MIDLISRHDQHDCCRGTIVAWREEKRRNEYSAVTVAGQVVEQRIADKDWERTAPLKQRSSKALVVDDLDQHRPAQPVEEAVAFEKGNKGGIMVVLRHSLVDGAARRT